jgi:NIMA (never in mitosis gene a)-related kinase
LCIELDYYECGDLNTKIKAHCARGQPMDDATVLFYLAQLCMALKHLHDQHVLHRDLKAANVFIAADGTLRVGDFGISRVLSNTVRTCRSSPALDLHLITNE